MKIDTTDTGLLEVWVSRNPDDFRDWAKRVKSLLDGRWTEKLDDLDESYWDLKVGELTVTVHRQHYLGVSVFSENSPSHRRLLERLGEIQ